MTKAEQTCCFTGHRKIPANQYEVVIERLEIAVRNLIENGIRYFGAGGALGFDTMAAQTILRLKPQYPHIKLILVLPCISQAEKWKAIDQKIYEEIKSLADKVVYTSRAYTQNCMYERNRHLVEGSKVCLCYLMHNHGGTAYTVNYARLHGLKVINLAGAGGYLL